MVKPDCENTQFKCIRCMGGPADCQASKQVQARFRLRGLLVATDIHLKVHTDTE